VNVVVVGGGTAGWLAALLIGKMSAGVHSVTLVESETIGTIGVGEGSTALLRGVLQNSLWDLGCDELEFMRQARSTPKLGILFKEWTDLDEQYMEPLDFPPVDNYLDSYPLLSYLHAKDIDISLSTVCGQLMKYNLSGFYRDGAIIEGKSGYAHHFDSKAAADYFKKVCTGTVKKISDTIEDININNEGFVESLLLKSGATVQGDFFIDASGFSRIFAKKMGVKFIEYKELSLNSAIPFRLDYKYFDEPFFYTVSWAQRYGWMWMIPRSDSVGCGYIYDDRYIDQYEAQAEIEEKLGTKIDVIKNIKFTAGRQETAWNKNVLSIGLSSNFLEPLEATSIHGTIAQLYNFIFFYLKDSLESTVIEESQVAYNNQTARLIDSFRDVILLHYAGVRKDTDFWKNINNNAMKNSNIKSMVDIAKTRLLSPFDIDVVYGGAGPEQFNWQLCALGHYPKDVAMKEVEKLGRTKVARDAETHIVDQISSRRWLSNREFMEFISSRS
jgi:hypothetical protein